MIKRVCISVIALLIVISLIGCNTSSPTPSSSDVEIIVEEQIIIEGDSVTSQTNTESTVSQEITNVDTDTSIDESVDSSVENSSQVTSSEPEKTDTQYEWKSHSQDYKLLAFTFDDGPTSKSTRLVNLFSAFDGAGTFFVNGNKINGDYEYKLMQSAIDAGWDIGNHGDNHLVATIGGAYGEATYDELKTDIDNLTHKLESHLTDPDGTPYKVSLYRPPNIKPTENSFNICAENNLAVIWLAHDAYDWDSSKTYNDRYLNIRNGIGTWKDGDIILAHETGLYSDDTYQILEETLSEFFRAGYRFCSITELMELRGISIDDISGKLNEADGNNGMVTNILDASKAGNN